MKYLLTFFLLISGLIRISAQPLQVNDTPEPTGGNTYAIIVGIASYADPEIQQLSFSNRDAKIFADFLMSASGGSVPKQNIRLLTDSLATIGEVDRALRWLINSAGESDKVFFYFSGHGEVENVTMNKNGYLICYNTPSVAFVNMGLSIDYLNDVANTLSVQSKAKVILITDACHSGNMSTNKFKGNLFVGEQLMLKKANEIRMASSLPDQLSNENVDWGGGRGVFSYYLVNGMQGGLADANNDGIVSLGELKKYMEFKMASDPILKKEGDVQTPAIRGDADFPLATVVKPEAERVRNEAINDSLAMDMVIATMAPEKEEDFLEPTEYLISLLRKVRIEDLVENLKLNSLPANQVSFTLLNWFRNNSGSETGSAKLLELENSLRSNKEEQERFNLDFGSVLLDVGQNVINNYITGDEAELERRRYYNSKNNGYDIYPAIFELAAKLSASDRYYNTKAKIFFHYFSGVALRLKIPLTEDPQPLIEQAFAEQKKALALEEYASYIYNELGVLYLYKNNPVLAEQHFLKAAELSQNWATPQSNLCGLFALRGEYDKALAAADKADSLQSGLQSISVNRGLVSQLKNNYLFAEEYYRNAIDINSRHYLPFEKLGEVYLNTTDYTLSDSFYYEAAIRKAGFHFEGNRWAQRLASPIDANSVTLFCDFDSTQIDNNDLLAFFNWGMQEYRMKNYDNALNKFNRVIALDKKNPLVFHYVGKIYYDQNKWKEAEIMFKYAIDYYMNEDELTVYADSLEKNQTFAHHPVCLVMIFMESRYNQIQDHYFIATAYERWGHFDEAEQQYRKIIQLTPENIGGYLKLWQMLEKRGLYTETEAVIKNYTPFDSERVAAELNAFYRRTIEKLPENADWNYRLGLLLYNRAQAGSFTRYLDTIVWFPKLNRELMIDRELRLKLPSDPDYAVKDIRQVTEGDFFTMGGNVEYLSFFEVPGTGEQIELARGISMPRKDGIEYLSRAAELISEKETLADIYFKIGNIYVWAGSKKQAYPHYVKSIALVPDNANVRMNLIEVCVATYKNRAALEQLNYLYDSSQINFQQHLLLAKFNIHLGSFQKALAMIDNAEAIHPYELHEIGLLRGRLNLMAGKQNEAIRIFKKLLETPGADHKSINYSIARLYAETGKTKLAWTYLQWAVDAGFNNSYVLQNDPLMKILRGTGKWKKMIDTHTWRSYSVF